jgi:hypothetical protein
MPCKRADHPLSRSALVNTRTRPNEDHDGRVAREYLFNWLQLVEQVHGTRGSFRAALS